MLKTSAEPSEEQIRTFVRARFNLDVSALELQRFPPDSSGTTQCAYRVLLSNGESLWVAKAPAGDQLFSFVFIAGQSAAEIHRRPERAATEPCVDPDIPSYRPHHPAVPSRPSLLPQRRTSRERFRIGGHDIQYVSCLLGPGEQVFCEAGAFLCRDAEIVMRTQALTDGSREGQSVLNRLLSPIKRVTAGESFFILVFSNPGDREREVCFAAPHPGSIIPWALTQGEKIVCQRGGFLCASDNIDISPFVGRLPQANLFGSEGLILQELSCRQGQGMAFVHVGGSLIEKTLPPGETYLVEAGSLAAWDGALKWNVSVIKDAKTLLFGKEGLFISALTNTGQKPARAYIQTLPFARLASRISALGEKKTAQK